LSSLQERYINGLAKLLVEPSLDEIGTLKDTFTSIIIKSFLRVKESDEEAIMKIISTKTKGINSREIILYSIHI